MGWVYRVISPFSTRFTDRFHVFDDQTVSAINVANILSLSGLQSIPKEYMHLENSKTLPFVHFGDWYIKVADLSKVFVDVGWNPEDLNKLINPENLMDVDRSLQKSKKRDREETSVPTDSSDDLIKLFAKRYVAENPEKVREVIVERLIGQNIAEFIKKL